VTLYRLDRPPGPCIGVDPGVNGGAAQFDGERWRAIEWRKRAKGWDVTEDSGVVLRWPKWSDALSGWIEYGDVDKAAGVEGIAYHAGKGNGLITLAEAAGAAVVVVGDTVASEVQRPTPNEWRRDVLGLSPRTGAAACATAAIHAVAGTQDPSRSRLVDLGVGLRLGEHAAEAVCIALWAAGCRLARVDGVA
jgi:hypothetical protein